MVLCRTLARNEHELSIEITPFENFYCICYHLDCPIQTYQKVVFALREKIEKNRATGRVINKKGDQILLIFPKKPSYFPKSLCWSK